MNCCLMIIHIYFMMIGFLIFYDFIVQNKIFSIIKYKLLISDKIFF